MFYQIFLSPQVKGLLLINKGLLLITYKHGICDLHQELPYSGKYREIRKYQESV